MSFTYLQRNKMFCKGKYGEYSKFEDAQAACTEDSNCVAVYDNKCDGGTFHLCPKKHYYRSSASSCIFAKTIQGKIFDSYKA